MACAPYAAGMAKMMAERVLASREADKQLHVIYLANDILFKAIAAKQLQEAAASAAAAAGAAAPAAGGGVAQYDAIVAAFAPFVGAMLAAAAKAAGDNTDQLLKVSRILDFWGEKNVFDASTMARVRREFASKDAAAAMAAAGAGQVGFAPPPQLAAPAAVVAPAYGYPPPGAATYAPGGWWERCFSACGLFWRGLRRCSCSPHAAARLMCVGVI